MDDLIEAIERFDIQLREIKFEKYFDDNAERSDFNWEQHDKDMWDEIAAKLRC